MEEEEAEEGEGSGAAVQGTAVQRQTGGPEPSAERGRWDASSHDAERPRAGRVAEALRVKLLPLLLLLHGKLLRLVRRRQLVD